jgi:hypothetical protein
MVSLNRGSSPNGDCWRILSGAKFTLSLRFALGLNDHFTNNVLYGTLLTPPLTVRTVLSVEFSYYIYRFQPTFGIIHLDLEPPRLKGL